MQKYSVWIGPKRVKISLTSILESFELVGVNWSSKNPPWGKREFLRACNPFSCSQNRNSVRALQTSNSFQIIQLKTILTKMGCFDFWELLIYSWKIHLQKHFIVKYYKFQFKLPLYRAHDWHMQNLMALKYSTVCMRDLIVTLIQKVLVLILKQGCCVRIDSNLHN